MFKHYAGFSNNLIVSFVGTWGCVEEDCTKTTVTAEGLPRLAEVPPTFFRGAGGSILGLKLGLSLPMTLALCALLSLWGFAERLSGYDEKAWSEGTKYGLISDSMDPLTAVGGTPVSFRGRFDATLPIFNRRIGLSVDLACSANSSDSTNDGMFYSAIPIRLAAAENLVAEIVVDGTSPMDTYLHLYCDPFNRAAPEANLVATDDDGGSGVLSAFVDGDGLALTPGDTYWIVVTTFSGGVIGDFHLQVANSLLPSTGKDTGADLEAFAWPYLDVWNEEGQARISVEGEDARLDVKRSSDTPANKVVMELKNNGSAFFKFANTYNGQQWTLNPLGNSFTFDNLNFPGQELRLYNTGRLVITPSSLGSPSFDLLTNGDLRIAGKMTADDYFYTSDRNRKRSFQEVDVWEILEKVGRLPVTTWRFDDGKTLHIGPMGQDFYALFGVGKDDKHLSPTDTAGVALAAIQGLYKGLQEKDAEIAALRARLDEMESLEAELAEIRAMLGDR